MPFCVVVVTFSQGGGAEAFSAAFPSALACHCKGKVPNDSQHNNGENQTQAGAAVARAELIDVLRPSHRELMRQQARFTSQQKQVATPALTFWLRGSIFLQPSCRPTCASGCCRWVVDAHKNGQLRIVRREKTHVQYALRVRDYRRGRGHEGTQRGSNVRALRADIHPHRERHSTKHAVGRHLPQLQDSTEATTAVAAR
jgi:hypothetical protein